MDHDHNHHHADQSSTNTPLIGGSASFHHSMDSNGLHGSAHPMAFHFGNIETILFNFWKTSNTGIVLSCVIVIAMCFIMELVRFLRAYRSAKKPSVMKERIRLEVTVSSFVLFDAVLHFAQLALSYLLMMTFMTFNVWICGAVLIGEVGSRLLFTILFPYLEFGAFPNAC
uniref:Copper transport protein n=1 Tax=Angiostrongylus cantonensis TaxID=6313 RepID=A0A0K0CUX1_ANGCA